MLRADEKQVTEIAEAIAKKSVVTQLDPVLKKIDELATRLAALEAKQKGKTDAKL